MEELNAEMQQATAEMKEARAEIIFHDEGGHSKGRADCGAVGAGHGKDAAIHSEGAGVYCKEEAVLCGLGACNCPAQSCSLIDFGVSMSLQNISSTVYWCQHSNSALSQVVISGDQLWH